MSDLSSQKKELSIRVKTVEFWMNECHKTNLILEHTDSEHESIAPLKIKIGLARKQCAQIARLRKEIQGVLQNDFLDAYHTMHFINMIRLCDGWNGYLRKGIRAMEADGGDYDLF